jgi:hypothetical protein
MVPTLARHGLTFPHPAPLGVTVLFVTCLGAAFEME